MQPIKMMHIKFKVYLRKYLFKLSNVKLQIVKKYYSNRNSAINFYRENKEEKLRK